MVHFIISMLKNMPSFSMIYAEIPVLYVCVYFADLVLRICQNSSKFCSPGYETWGLLIKFIIAMNIQLNEDYPGGNSCLHNNFPQEEFNSSEKWMDLTVDRWNIYPYFGTAETGIVDIRMEDSVGRYKRFCLQYLFQTLLFTDPASGLGPCFSSDILCCVEIRKKHFWSAKNLMCILSLKLCTVCIVSQAL